MGVARWLLDLAARLLEHDEREVVLGDLTESDTRFWRGTTEILGLVLRRQAANWSHWRPWFAAFGITVPGTALLIGVSLSVTCTYQRLSGAALCSACAPTAQEDSLLFVCQILLLLLWSWTGGFVVGMIARRTLWVSGALSLVVAGDCLESFHETSVSRLCLLLFLPPALLGVQRGLRIIRISRGLTIALATLVTALMVCAWTNQGLWILNWALVFPAWYMALSARTRLSPDDV
jgi:hypothetical protein